MRPRIAVQRSGRDSNPRALADRLLSRQLQSTRLCHRSGDGQSYASTMEAPPVLASIVSVAHTIGYPALFLLVMAEAGGAPVPSETALITGAVVANQGQLEVGLLMASADPAAIIGAHLGS